MLQSHFLFSCRSLLGPLSKLSSHYTGVQVSLEDTGHSATALLISITVFLPVLSLEEVVLLDSIDRSQGRSSEEVAVTTFRQEITFQLLGCCFLHSLVLG